MAPMPPRLKVLSVGGNPVSAFLSWRLQATNACDVTLVWKSGFEHVAQYGISFKSSVYGNERFKPRQVVRAPEEAASSREGPYDYVVLCIKALPDIYDLAAVIDAVVTPQHTCILVNTTHTLGVEAAIEERFPTNVVLSLVSGAELSQLGQSEFEHRGSTELWVGPANKNNNIPVTIQEDMAQALAMTLSTGQVDCKVSHNIRQQQYEKVIGPIAFHPASIIFETPNHGALLEKVGVRELVSDVIDELLNLATEHSCKFPVDFKQKVIEDMTRQGMPESIMWQDFVAKRPMEVETYLGSPIKLAQEANIKVSRIETLYSILHHLNIVNRQRPRMVDSNGMPPPGSPTGSAIPRMPSQNSQRPMMNGGGPNGMYRPQPRPRNSSNLGGMRRPPPPMNGNGPPNGPPNGYGRPPNMSGPPSRAASRRGSMEGADLEEFSHLVLYDDIPEGGHANYPQDPNEIAFREREAQLRNREMALRDQEMRMRRQMGTPGPGPGPGGPRRGPHPMRNSAQVFDDDDDDDDDYFDPANASGPPMIDPDNFDMMSVTSKKNRKTPSTTTPSQFRKNPEYSDVPQSRGSRFRPSFGRNRSSQMSTAPSMGADMLLNDPLMSFTSNRYGTVDRSAMHAESRTNSMTSEVQFMPMPPGQGPNGNMPRRSSQSPGVAAAPYSPSLRGGMNMNGGRPSPPGNYGPSPPQQNGGRPSPPGPGGDVRQQAVPRFPQGQGNNMVAPQQVEQHIGVSGLHPPKFQNVRSLTGSASASAESGDSEPSANSSQSSLQHRPPIGVR